jgi:hypothetical protein
MNHMAAGIPTSCRLAYSIHGPRDITTIHQHLKSIGVFSAQESGHLVSTTVCSCEESRKISLIVSKDCDYQTFTAL